MSAPYAARIVEVASDDTVPGRLSDAALRELAAALGGDGAPERDPWEALAEAFRALSTQQLGERLLEAMLLQPPIPAGCEALLARMTNPDDAPWRDHDVLQDRLPLWTCHSLVHRVFPDVYPAPRVGRVTLQLVELVPGLRTPGRRSPPRDRTTFFARALRDRPGADNPISATWPFDAADDASWSYDVVWATSFGERAAMSADDVGSAFQARPAGPSALCTTATAWLPTQWLGDAADGQAWLTHPHIDPVG